MAYSSPSTFFKSIWLHAKQEAKQLGVNPQVLAANTALEKAWRCRVIRHSDGRNGNNLFGIKAGGTWKSESMIVPTAEYRGGNVFKEKAAFRFYDLLTASFQDYVQFLQNNAHYPL